MGSILRHCCKSYKFLHLYECWVFLYCNYTTISTQCEGATHTCIVYLCIFLLLYITAYRYLFRLLINFIFFSIHLSQYCCGTRRERSALNFFLNSSQSQFAKKKFQEKSCVKSQEKKRFLAALIKRVASSFMCIFYVLKKRVARNVTVIYEFKSIFTLFC